MARFLFLALPLLILILAAFGALVGVLDLEPRAGSVIRLALFEQPRVPATVVLGAWVMEACGLLALFLIAHGRCGAWWLDGLVAGWLAWVFRGPLLVLTVVVATRQPQGPWWRLALAWWVLYSLCGLALGWLAGTPAPETEDRDEEEDEDPDPDDPDPDDSNSDDSADPSTDGGTLDQEAPEAAESPKDSEKTWEETRTWVEAYDSEQPSKRDSSKAPDNQQDP